MEGEEPGLRATLIMSLPFATAIGVFGVVFGAAASAIIDPLLVLAAAAGAVIVAPLRSLPLCLVAGLCGYVVGDLALRLL